MSTFLTDMINKGYTKKEVLDVLFESEQEKERRRIAAIVTKTVDALRLKIVRLFLAYQQLSTWRRMNGFDRVTGEESRFNGHRSLPPTPQEYYAGLWSEVNALKAAIPMPAEDTASRPRQKDFLDELLANFKFARIKEYVEMRSRNEAAQVQVTVTQMNTVQHSSPYGLIPNHRHMYVLIWRTTRGGWTRSWTSSKHHQLVRLSKRPDSSVPQTRGFRRLEELPTPAY